MEIVRQLLAVVLVLASLVVTLWWLRRRNPVHLGFRIKKNRRRRILESVERLPLSSQHTLHLVRVADRVLVLAVHSSGCSLLESRSWKEVNPGQRAPELIPELLEGARR